MDYYHRLNDMQCGWIAMLCWWIWQWSDVRAYEYDNQHTHTHQDFTLNRAWESFVWQIMRTWFVYKFIHHAAFIIIGKWCNTLLYAKLTHDELMHLLDEDHVYVAFIYSLRELQFEYHKIISSLFFSTLFLMCFFFRFLSF